MEFLSRLFRSSHDRLREDLGAYVDGNLTGSARLAVERHLEGCLSCRRETEELRIAITTLRQLPAVAASRSFAVTAPAAVRRADSWSALMPTLRLASASLAAIAIVATAVNLAAPVPVRDASSSAPPTSIQPAPARPPRMAREAVAPERAESAPAVAAVAASAPGAEGVPAVGAAPPSAPDAAADRAPAVAPGVDASRGAVAKRPPLSYAPRRPTPTAPGIVDRTGQAVAGTLERLPDARIPWLFVALTAALAAVGTIGLWSGRR